MALEHNMVSPLGFTANAAYIRVEDVRLHGKANIEFRVRGYVSIGYPAFIDCEYRCAYDLTGDNPIRQAYLHLKTLPEFAGATDC